MKNYVVNCYTCEHNGQETCKGCNTLLNGEDEPYENWELREDLNEKDQQISDLEAKLAEKEKIIEIQHNGIGYWKSVAEKRPDIDYVVKIKDLKQQLAEKEKEIEEMQKNVVVLVRNKEIMNLESIRNFIDEEIEIENDLSALRLSEFLNSKIKNAKSSETLQEHNQDKISFAVEQLEKVRKTIKNLHGQKNVKIGNSYIQKKDKLYNKYIIELDILENVLEIFDNQINELKEMK